MEKKGLKLLLCALAIGLCVSLANADIETGLTAYWPLNDGSGDTAVDAGPNSHNGTLHNEPTWADGPEGNSGAISFDFTDDYISCGTYDPTPGNEVTISFWAYCNANASGSHELIMGTGTNWTTTKMQLYRRKYEGYIGIQRPGSYCTFDNMAVLGPNEWAHFIITADSSNVSKIYRDGVLLATSTWIVSSDSSDCEVNIGASYVDPGDLPHQPWNGMLDEIRFYDRALTADDAMELFEYPSDPTFNISPRVNAGDYQSLLWQSPSVTAQLNATVTDDGKPADPCEVTMTWSKTSGPGTVVFSDTTIEDPTATFDAAGMYELQLRGFDGEKDSCDVVEIMVRASNDPIAYWDFNEGSDPVNDDSANNNVGTRAGGSEPNWVSGWVGSGALEFFGSSTVNSYVDIATDATIDPNLDSIRREISLTAWIKTEEINMIVLADSNHTWRLGASSVQIGKLYFACNGLVGSNILYTESTVNDGYWHHIAAVYDSAMTCMYVDGVLESSGASSGLININDLPVTVGAYYEDATTAVSHSWNGMLDDVRVYSYGISADQVAALAAMAPLIPVVDAGEDQTYAIQHGPLQLDAMVVDDGNPVAATLEWTQTSGPGTAAFSDTTIEDPRVTFDVLGSYVLRLTADDTVAAVSDEVTITVVNPTCQDVIDDGLLLLVDFSGPDGVPDCYIDLYDFAALAGNWLYCNDPQDPECELLY